MKEEFVYCHLWWVDGLVWRLLCQESDFGPIRGLTVEEYETLKPKVEKLTVDSFAQTKKIWPNMTGPSKEEIEKQIDYVKTKFKDFEKHLRSWERLPMTSPLRKRTGGDLQSLTISRFSRSGEGCGTSIMVLAI